MRPLGRFARAFASLFAPAFPILLALAFGVGTSAVAPGKAHGDGIQVSRESDGRASLASRSIRPLSALCEGTELTIAKSHTGDFTVGQDGTFTLRVSNLGAQASAGTITVIDTLPAGLTFVRAAGTGWTISSTGGVVTATTDASIGSGSSSSFTLTVGVEPAAIPGVTNVADVSGGNDTDPSNNRATDCVMVCGGIDLTIDKSHAGSFTVGRNGTYTIRVTNLSGSASSGSITVRDTLPSGLGFVRASGSGWTFTYADSIVTAFHANPISAHGSSSFTLTVSVGAAAVPQVINAATVSGGSDTNPANNRDTDPTRVCGVPDPTIHVSHEGCFTIGENATYTITVSNVGSAPTTGTLMVRDSLPAGLTFVSAAGSGWTITQTGGVVTATTTASIPAGGSSSFTLTVAVGSTAAPRVTDVATVTGGGDGNLCNNRDSDCTPICGSADLSIDVSHEGCFTIGGNGTYTIAVSNLGTLASGGTITVRDTLPTGLTFVSASGSGWTITNAGGIVTATTGAILAPAGSSAFTLTVAVGPAAAPQVTNAATVSGAGDVDTANDRDADATLTCGQPDLSIDVSHEGCFTIGGNGTYTIAVSNLGTLASGGTITVRDTLPTGLTFVSASGSGWTITNAGGIVTATTGAILAPAGSSAFTLTVAVGPAAAPQVTNAATVSGGGDVDTANDRDADATLTCGQPDLSIDVSHEGCFTIGGNGTYTIAVSNLGTLASGGTITVRDTLPAGLTFVSAAGTGWTISQVGGIVTATTGAILAPAGSSAFTLTVAVGPAAAPQVTNAATVSGGGDVATANDRDADATLTCGQPDLSIDVSHEGCFTIGGNGTYTIAVSNLGTLASGGTITVRDTLPTGLTFVSAAGTGWTISQVGGIVTATTGAILAPAGSSAFTLTVAVGPAAAPQVTNAATVSGAGDVDTANDRDADATLTCGQPDLSIDVSHEGCFTIGGNGTYTIAVSNLGTLASGGTITVRDTLPAGLTFVSAAGTGWTISQVGGIVTATTGAILAPAGSSAFTLTVAVGPAAAPQVTNAATVSGGGDVATANDRDADATLTCGQPDLSIDVSHEGCFTIGGNGTYAIAVSNLGTLSSGGTITVRDTLPTGLTFVSASGSGWTITNAGGIVTATTGAILAPAGSSAFTLTVAVGPAAAPQVTNAATVSGAGDVATANDRDADATLTCALTDLTISKTHTGTFVVGGNGTYTIAVTNVGGLPSAGTITVRDTLPAGLTFVSASGSGWTITNAGGIVTATTSAILAPAGSSAYAVTVAIGAAAVPQVVNAATVSGGGDTNPSNNRAIDTAPVAGQTDLAIDVSHEGCFTIGGNGTYTVAVSNLGTLSSGGTITVRDTLPTGLTFVSASGSGWTITNAGGIVTATTGAILAPAGSSAFTLVVAVGPAAAPQVTNAATVSGGGDVATANDRDADATLTCALTDLTISKTHTGTFVVGGNGTYTIAVTNVGTLASAGTITVRDTLPAGLTFVSASGSGWTITNAGGIVTATTSAILAPAGSSAYTVTVAIGAAAVPQVVNAATVSGGGDTDPSNNRAIDTAPVAGQPDLSIDVSHEGCFTIGGNGTYTIAVSNLGTLASAGTITVRDTLPAGLTFVSAAGTGWTISNAGGIVTATTSTVLAPAASSAFTLVVAVGPAAAPQVTNAATVSGGGDVDTANDRDADATLTCALTDLTISKTHTGTFVVGGNGTYTIAVTNVGTLASAGTITVRDTLPAGLTFVSASGSGWTITNAGGIVTATTSAILAPAGSSAYTVTVAIGAAAVPQVVNAATVSGGGDTDPSNNRAIDTAPVAGQPDLSIDVSHEGCFTIGGNGTYTIAVSNLGTLASAGTITVRDTLPAGLTFVSAAGTGWTISNAGGIVTATTSTVLAPAASSAFTLVVAVAPAAAPQVTNAATVSGGGDVDTANDRDADATLTCALTDLTISKTHTGTFSVGGNGTYTIAVTNVGTLASAGTITVRDTLPAGLTFVSAAGSGWTITNAGGIVTATISAILAPAGSSSYTLTVAIGAAAVPQVVNAATVSGGGDTDPNNNRAIDTAPVAANTDLTISKTHTGTFVVGGNGTYAIAVTNVGGLPSAGTITVRDTLPAGLTFVSAAGSGWTISQVGGIVTATTSTVLAPAGSSAYTVTVAIGAAAVPQVVNAATVSGGGDTDPNNNRAIDTAPVAANTDLTISKTHTGTFVVGGNGTYTIAVTNVGGLPSAGTITVRDTLPAGLTFVSAAGTGWTISNSGGIVTATTSAILAPAGSSSYTLTVAIGAAAVPQVVNAATVSGGGDTDPNNNRAIDTAPVAANTDLTISKTHTGTFVVGGNGAYTIAVTNVGTLASAGTITVRDTLPAGLTFVSAAGTGWTITNAGGIVTATTSAILAPAGSSSYTVTVAIGAAAVPQVVNAATVSGGGDTDPSNNRAIDTAPVGLPGALVVQKSASPTEVEIGDVVRYTILIKNAGGTDLTKVHLDDRLPTGLRYLAGTARLDGRTIADPAGMPGPALRFAIGDMVAGQTRTLRYQVSVGAGAALGSRTNLAFASTPDDSTTVPVTPGVRSNLASATIELRGGAFSDEGIVLGKIFLDCDCDSNRVQGPEELGVPGVRVYLEDGTSAVTDAEGKYSFQHVRPRLHVVRVDHTTLPPGAQLKPLSNRNAFDGLSQFVDLEQGEMFRADFAEGTCSSAVLASVKARRQIGEISGPIIEGVVPVVAAEPGASPGGDLTLTPSATRVPADGASVLTFRLHRGDAAPAGPVTLETTAGEWTVADEDAVTPGVQLALPAGERIVGLRAPLLPTAARVRITAGALQDSAEVTFVPMRRPLVLNGLLEGRLSARSLKDDALCTSCRDDFEDRLRDASFDSDGGRVSGAARGALFLKGSVADDVLLTVRYDSERDAAARRFRDIRPLEGYDVLGDASVHAFDAQSTSRLFARVDRGASFAQFGDFNTPASDARQLGAYTRSLNGGLARLDTRFVQFSGYGTQAREVQVVDELPGQGVSGPYALTHADGVLGTEQVEVLVRDRNQPSHILRREPQTRFADYTLEPFTGRLVFRQPVPSLDGDLNPVSIRVTYEVQSTGAAYGIYGGELTVTPDPRVAVAFSASRDEDPASPWGLASANATVRPLAGLMLGAEVAHSDSGGALFDGARKAEAWRGELRLDQRRVAAHAYALHADQGFDNASAGVTPGREELGGDARLTLGATSLFGRALRTRDLVTDGRRDGVEAGLGQRFGRVSAEGAYRWASETKVPASALTSGVAPLEVSSVRGRLASDLPWVQRGTVFGEVEQDLKKASQERWALGGDLQVAPRTRLYARHENTASFAGPFALNTQQEQAQTVVGLAGDELRDGYVFSEYRARDAFAGRDVQAAMGLRDRWALARGVRLDGSVEHVEAIRGGSGGSTALTGGVEFTRDPLWKGTARAEFRTQSHEDRWLGSADAARKLSRDWTGLARSTWYVTPDQDMVNAVSQVGVAWRQTDRDVWNGLARYENRVDRVGRGVDPYRQVAHLVAGDLDWHPAQAWTVGGQAAARWTIHDQDGVRVRSDAQLFSGRGRVDLTPRLDLGVIGRALTSDHFHARQSGLGAELGVTVARDLRLAAGYNVFGFRVQDMAGADCTDRGPYVRMGVKLGEGLFHRGRGPATDVAAVPAPPQVVTRALATAATAAADAQPGTIGTSLTPLAQRTRDDVIAADVARIEAWQGRLAALPGAARDPWRATAARSWLDVARSEYTVDDETGFAQDALVRGAALVQAIAAGSPPVGPADVPAVHVPEGSSRVRDDLWRELERLKHDPGFPHAAEDLARLEVLLAWAGNEAIDQGDCADEPLLAQATQLASDARAKEAAAVKPEAPAPAPPVVIPPPPPLDLHLLRNVHFAFDRCEVSPESRKVVENVAEALRRDPSLRVRLVGHTDVRGTDAYNMGLSACRVCTVRGLLDELGIPATRIISDPRGRSELLTRERTNRAHALNRRVELVLLDESGREIPAEPQERDLQMEAPRPHGHGLARPAAAEFPKARLPECLMP